MLPNVLATTVGLLSCLLLGGEASQPRRLLADEEVLASQRFFSTQWRKRFNQGDVIYCGQAFVGDASLHLSFGPLAGTVKRLVYLPDPAVLHGQVPIEAFWNASQQVLGFKDMKGYQDDGTYSSTALAVDDNTVLVSSPVAWTSGVREVRGQTTSELWVRVGLQWKLRSMMLAIKEVEPPAVRVLPETTVPRPKEVVEPPAVRVLPETPKAVLPLLGEPVASVSAAPAALVPAAVVTTTGAGITATAAVEQKRPQSSSAGIVTSEAAVNKTIVAAAGDAAVASAANSVGGHGNFMIAVMALLIVGSAAIMWRRAKNRREAAISGFEAMLG